MITSQEVIIHDKSGRQITKDQHDGLQEERREDAAASKNPTRTMSPMSSMQFEVARDNSKCFVFPPNNHSNSVDADGGDLIEDSEMINLQRESLELNKI